MGSLVRITLTATACLLAVSLANPGPQAQETRLSVTGDDGDLETAISRASLVMSLEDEDEKSAQDYVASARADYRRILNALYAKGYYSGTVSIRVNGQEVSGISPFDAPTRIRAVDIRVDPGPAFTFGTADIAPLPAGTRPPAAFARGEPALSGVVRDATSEAIGAWRAESHAKAHVASDAIVARHTDRRLDARVRLDPGPALRFGPLTISGNSAVRTERIRAITGYYEGDVFDPEALEMAARRLRRTGTFRSVSLVEADDYTPDLRLPIALRVEERKPRRIGAGLEYSSLDGITASAYWMHRNLLGGAETFRVEGEISQIGKDADQMDYHFGISFDRPATFGPDNTLNAKAKLGRTQDPGYSIDFASVELGISRIVNESFTLTAGVGVKAADVTDALGQRDYILLTFPLTSSLDRRDDARDATSGYYIAASLTPFASIYGSSSGLRATADARYYRSLPTERQVTFAGRLQMGSLIGPSAMQAPADFLFFSGGGNTVRGHPYQSLGQTLPDGKMIGGRSFLGASVEARVQVRGDIGAVLFADYGYISDDPVPGRDGHAHAGAGIGIRYDTRLGPIRFDVATPVGYGQTGDDVQFYIGIGQAF